MPQAKHHPFYRDGKIVFLTIRKILGEYPRNKYPNVTYAALCSKMRRIEHEDLLELEKAKANQLYLDALVSGEKLVRGRRSVFMVDGKEKLMSINNAIAFFKPEHSDNNVRKNLRIVKKEYPKCEHAIRNTEVMTRKKGVSEDKAKLKEMAEERARLNVIFNGHLLIPAPEHSRNYHALQG